MKMKIEELIGAAFLTEYGDDGKFRDRSRIDGELAMVNEVPYVFVKYEFIARELTKDVGPPDMIFIAEAGEEIDSGHCEDFSEWKNTNSHGFTENREYIEYGFRIQAKGY